MMIAHLCHRLILPLVRCAYELGALFDGYKFIEDVSHHSSTFLKHDPAGANDAFGLAADNDLVCLYIAAAAPEDVEKAKIHLTAGDGIEGVTYTSFT